MPGTPVWKGGGGALRILCEGCPVYTGYARYENSNLVSRNYSIRTYCTSSNSNLVNRTYCPKPNNRVLIELTTLYRIDFDFFRNCRTFWKQISTINPCFDFKHFANIKGHHVFSAQCDLPKNSIILWKESKSIFFTSAINKCYQEVRVLFSRATTFSFQYAQFRRSLYSDKMLAFQLRNFVFGSVRVRWFLQASRSNGNTFSL